MKTKRLISILLSIVLLFSSLSAVFYSTSSAMAESQGDSTELVDAVYVGKSGTDNPIVANIFFPLTVNKATPEATETFYQHNKNNSAVNDQVYFKLTFKAKMFSGGIYRNKSGVIKATDLGPVVGFVSYDFSNKYPLISKDDVQSMRPKPSLGSKNHSYSYDPVTGTCEVIFKPTIKGDSNDNNGVYGAITIGNAEHGPAGGSTDVFGETDFDASFIISEPALYAYNVNSKTAYGDNLFQDADGNAVGFESSNVDTNSTFRVDEPNYTEKDSMLTAPRYKWHVDTGDSLIEKIKVPADYITSNSYDAANFVKHNETEYTREYYTNDNYPGLDFVCLKNSDNKAFSVVKDLNKKMIVLSANHEGMPEGSYGGDYTSSNRYANLMIPINSDQYLRPLDQPYPTGQRVFFKVTMTAKRLEGEGAPLLGRFYGESNVAKASNNTSYSFNVGEPASGAGNESGLPQNTYNPDTGEFVGYVLSYANDTDHDETSSGHAQWITIGNGEHKGDHDMFWSTCFNSSFAITYIKVDLYSYDNNGTDNKLGALIAEDIAPGLFGETIDNENPRCYRANNRSGVAFDKYDATNAPQKQWSVDGAIDLVHTYDLTKCVLENHTNNFTHTEISSTNLDSWYCPTCDIYYKDNLGVEKYGTTSEVEADHLLDISQQMVRIKGTSSSPAYLAIPLKLAGFTGHGYFMFSCVYKKIDGADPVIRIYEARREGQKGGATPDSTVKPVYQAIDPYTMRLNVIFDVWRPAKSSYSPFFYVEPDTGGNFLMLIGNSELAGAGYKAVDSEFAFSDPQIVRMNGNTPESGEMVDAVNVTMAPISDKTVTIDSPYAVGQYESWYYADVNSPLAAKLNRWYDIGGNITVEDIPNKFFAIPQGISFDNTNATISSFQTISSGKTYSFYYNGKIESDEVPKPFVEFISENGTAKKEYLQYTTDAGGKYSFKATFTSPSGLRSTKNIRIGIDIGSTTITGKVANFSLTEVSADSTDSNLLVNGFLADTDSLVPYSADTPVGVWMYEGTLGNVVIDSIPGSTFIIPATYMATFVGTNDNSTEARNANDGRPKEGYIAQSVTVEKGQKYRVSYNVRYANKGYDEYQSKSGAEFTYISTSGEKTLEVPVTESDTEYKEIYEFTIPDDIDESENNFTFTFNFWGAFVSGNVANFQMHKLDNSGNDYGRNMFVEGTFPDGKYENGWTKSASGTYFKFGLSEVPENYFSKVDPYAGNMLHFEKTADWAYITSSPMLKPDTNYEWCYSRIYSTYDSDKKPYTASSMFKPDNKSMSDSDFTAIRTTETFESKKFKTDSNLALYGNNNMILRYYMRQNSTGYYANLQLYELDENGKRISENLYVNGDFAAGYNAFELSDKDMSSNTFEAIPEGFFDIPESFEIQNMKGTVSAFATVTGNKEYTFYYNGRFYSNAVAKPFVEFIAPNGTTTRKYLEYTRDSDQKYNFKANFTTPSNLRIFKNIRVGFDVDSKGIDGSVADFSLTVSGSSGRNILKNGNFNDVSELVPYDETVGEGIWMYEGDTGNSYFAAYISAIYQQGTANMVTFVGRNDNSSAAKTANNGIPYQGTLSQEFTLKKGKKYKLSFNVKYVNKGYAEYGSKVGAEFSYTTDSSTEALVIPIEESAEEYKEIYVFTAPDDIKESGKNFKFTFNAWGSFVSGYIANFSMYQIDDEGNATGRNMFVLGDFAGGDYAPGWTRSDSSTFTTFAYSKIPENFFSKTTPYTPRMLHFKNISEGNYWPSLTNSPMLKPNTNYEWCYNRIYASYDSDKKPYTTATTYKPSSSSLNNEDFFEILSGKTFESKKFKTASTLRLYGSNNMLLRYYMRKNADGYYANLQLYELDDEGNRISGNLLINGDFVADYNGYELQNTNITTDCIEEIPQGFFDEPTEIQIKNAEGTVSTFATVSSKKTYAFYYDGKFESENVPKPFVEFISSDGNIRRKYLDYDRNINGGYNFQSAFITPAGLRSEKNIRIGIDIDSKDITGSVANFSLVEISGDSEGDNLLQNGNMIEVKDLTPYSDSVAEGIWMYEGDMGESVVGASIFASYEQDVPIMIMFRGKNQNDSAAEKANDGRPCEAKLSQKFTLTPGKKYRISFNAKFVSKGYEEFGSKAGAELLYARTSDDSPKASVSSTMTESDTEYRETYDFTMPDDAKNSSNNFQFNFNYWGAFVSGYCANFTMYEIDNEGKTVGDNLFLQGDFAGKTYYPGWDNSSYTNWTTFQYVPVPEDFFKKNGNYRPKMIYFHGQEDWAWFSYSPMLKPDTNYELTFGRIITDEDSSKVSYQSDSMFYPNIEGVMTNTAMDSSYFTTDVTTETSQTRIFRTKPDVRLYGGNNMILRWYMREASAGYYGNIELYELDDAGKRVGNNIFLNWDFVAGFKANETYGVVDTWRFVEIPDGFFNAKESYSQMVTSKGTSANANYIVKATVNRFKKQFLEFRYVGMNSSGVTPIVQYPAYDESGNVVYRSVPISSFYDSNRYYYEAAFTLPADAISKDGMTDIQILFNNGNKGKGYFTNIKVVEDGKYVNQVTSAAADKSGNFETVAYDSSVFVFYYDDTKFDDGDWSGERSANAYNIPTGNVTGVVLDENFSPVVGARIRLQPGNLTTTTDSTGAYLFEGLNPGNYKLYLETAGVSLFCMDITVEKGMTYNAPSIIFNANGDAVIDSGITDNSGNGGEIVGIYYGRDGKPKANVRIYITKSVYAETDKNGRFEFKNIKPNTYKLYVRVGDRYYELREVTVQAQKRISIKVLEPLFEEDETFLEMIENFFYDYTLYAVLACVGAALVLGGIVFLIIFLATRKKRKAKKAAQ